MHTVTMLLAQAQGGASPLGTLIFPLAILAIFYFILIVPQRRELKKHQQLVAELQRGDQVVTAGGLIGEIMGVKDDTVQLRTGTATVVVEKARVVRKVVAGAEPAAEKK
ncbi:MAG TPA: preprotein translocase subunit YajC [Longimicrobiaceae bacterium]|nr:preprotein translocase subunit YajC [Longimicrobiaceae bacterium]